MGCLPAGRQGLMSIEQDDEESASWRNEDDSSTEAGNINIYLRTFIKYVNSKSKRSRPEANDVPGEYLSLEYS